MKKFKHLLDDFKPETYQLELTTDPSKTAFSGSVTITGKKISKSSTLTLHAKDLKIARASINDQDAEAKIKGEHDELDLVVKDQVEGKIEVHLEFSGDITQPMHGIYPSSYKEKGKTKKLLSTQFESHHAREAFPCIDEPAAKATFDLTLVTPPHKSIIGNTPIKSQSKKANVVTTVFETSPIMSTYLLAFVVGDLKSKSAKTASGVEVNTWATPDQIDHTDFALDCAVKTLEYFEDYFKLKYPLAKCDFVAIPDFSAGAMENWGLITFREAAMLVDDKNTSLGAKQWVALVVAHELAHQWFGNLVTMEWWTDLWLNEGFASWVEYLAVDKLFPEWNVWTQFVTDDYLRGRGLDSLKNTHPIEVPIGDPDEIRSIFDGITYSKGASVIRMLHAYLGPEDFQKGLTAYLKKYKYANASTVDLWESLEKATKKPVRKFMSAWTSNKGFPVVSVSKSKQGLNLEQTRFSVTKLSNDKQLWPIPIDIIGSKETALLEKPKASLKLKSKDADIYLNKAQTGFYLTRYDEEILNQHISLWPNYELDESEQVGLLADQSALTKAGLLPTITTLKMIYKSSEINSYVVWDQITGQLGAIRAVIADEDLVAKLRTYSRNLAKYQLNRLTFNPKESDSHFDTLMRPMIIGLASFGKEASVIENCRKLYDSARSLEDFHPDFRGVILSTVVKNTDDPKTTYQQIKKWYEESSSAQAKVSAISALTHFEDEALIKDSLSYIKSKHVKLQEVSYWLAYSFSNRHAKELTWDWFVEEWDWLEKNLGGDIGTIGELVKRAGAAFSDKEHIDRYKKFTDSINIGGINQKIDQAIESITWQSDWKERELDNLKTFFK